MQRDLARLLTPRECIYNITIPEAHLFMDNRSTIEGPLISMILIYTGHVMPMDYVSTFADKITMILCKVGDIFTRQSVRHIDFDSQST